MKILLLAAVSWAGVVASKTFPAKEVKSIRIETEAGSITVEPGAEVSVEAVKPDGSTGKCELKAELHEGQVLLGARKPQGTKEICDGSFRVKAPRGAKLEAYSGSGAVTVKGLRGEMKIRTGAGSVTASGVEAPLHILTGGGDVKVDAAATPWLDVRTGAGKIEVAAGKERATISLRSGNGDIKVTAPKGVKAKIKAQAASKQITNSIPEDANGPLRLEAFTGAGHISLESR